MASSAYADSVASLRSSLNFLESSVEILDNGVSDFPRLVNVLKTVRVRIKPTLEERLLRLPRRLTEGENPIHSTTN